MKDHFPTAVLKPNPECGCKACRDQQAEWAPKGWVPMEWNAKGHDGAGNEDAETVHEDNDWGIEVCDESEPAPAAAAAAAAPAAAGPGAGLEFKYAPAAAGAPADEDDGAAEEDGGQSIEDLMASLQAASS